MRKAHQADVIKLVDLPPSRPEGSKKGGGTSLGPDGPERPNTWKPACQPRIFDWTLCRQDPSFCCIKPWRFGGCFLQQLTC